MTGLVNEEMGEVVIGNTEGHQLTSVHQSHNDNPGKETENYPFK